MASSMEWSPRPEPRAGIARVVNVAVYEPDAPSGQRYRLLPNIACEQVQYREGAEPPSARFRYVLDDRARAMGWPTQFETILRLHGKARPTPEAEDDEGGEKDAEKPEVAERYVVKTDDRLVVMLHDPLNPNARPSLLFDGFAQSPQVDITPHGQSVTFVAAGVAIRCWDEPLTRRRVQVGGDPYWDDLPPVFNESRLNDEPETGNHTQLSGLLGDNYRAYFTRDHGGLVAIRKRWSLDAFAWYLLQWHNKEEKHVKNPDLDEVFSLLVGRTLKEGAEFIDPSDESTYEDEKLFIPEYDATGKAWPEAMWAMLEHYGFGMAFRCKTNEGEPECRLDLYRKDGSGRPVKSIPAQANRSRLNTAKQSISSMALSRDSQSAFNGVLIVRPPALIEICVVLAPAFVIAPGDEGADQVVRFQAANLKNAEHGDYNKYRRWVACDAYTDVATATDGVYQLNGTTSTLCKMPWVAVDERATNRRRPARPWLLNGEPARLEYSINYKGAVAAVNDPKQDGDWRPIPWGRGWQLLKDQLGVRLTCDDPNAWNIGQAEDAIMPGRPTKNHIVKGVRALTAPDDATPSYFLRLTAVVEADGPTRLKGDGPAKTVVFESQRYDRREASSLKFTRYRHVVVGDEFRDAYVHQSSSRYASLDNNDKRSKDPESGLVPWRYVAADLDAHALQLQQAHENPPVAGTITIPWLTDAYEVGDQIDEITGRGLSLQINAGDEQGEGKRYPFVIGVDWNMSGDQSTTLHLSDRRAEPILR